LLAAFFVREAG